MTVKGDCPGSSGRRFYVIAAGLGIAGLLGFSLYLLFFRSVPHAPVPPHAAKQWDARITGIEGDVFLHTSEMKEGTWVEVNADIFLSAGDSIRTGYESRAELSFDGDHIFEVGANSAFKIEGVERRGTFLHLSLGKFLAKIDSLLKGRSILVRTPTLVASIRGTELAVEYQGEGKPTIVGILDDGVIFVRGIGLGGRLGKEIKLKKGYEMEVYFGKKAPAPKKLEVMLPYKKRMKELGKRRLVLKKTWKKVKPEKKKEIRRKLQKKKPLRKNEFQKRFKKSWESRHPDFLKVRELTARPPEFGLWYHCQDIPSVKALRSPELGGIKAVTKADVAKILEGNARKKIMHFVFRLIKGGSKATPSDMIAEASIALMNLGKNNELTEKECEVAIALLGSCLREDDEPVVRYWSFRALDAIGKAGTKEQGKSVERALAGYDPQEDEQRTISKWLLR